METKECIKCKRVLDINNFTKHSKRKRKNTCRQCVATYHRQHYLANKDTYLKKARIHRLKDRERNRQISRAAKNQPCVDCGVKYPYYVMQFDHLPEYEKTFTIGQNRLMSIERLESEIAKCDVVCSNCHAERSHQRRNKASDRN